MYFSLDFINISFFLFYVFCAVCPLVFFTISEWLNEWTNDFEWMNECWFLNVMWQIDSVLKIPTKQQVFSCVHSAGSVTIFSLYDCRVLDIRQINDWTKETNAAWLDGNVALNFHEL